MASPTFSIDTGPFASRMELVPLSERFGLIVADSNAGVWALAADTAIHKHIRHLAVIGCAT
jgi:hypothetical protein